MRVMKSGPGGYHVGLFGRPTMMREEEKEKEGGGGEEETFEQKFSKLFNKAFGDREKRLETKLMKTLETTIGSKLEEIAAKLSEKKEGEEKLKPDDKRQDGKLPPEIAAEISKAQKDAKEARDLAEKFKKEAEQEKARALKTEERQLLVSTLNGKVKPQLLDMVVDTLHGKHLTRDPETNKILWKGEDGDILPFKDGVDGWAKSDFGKEVAPPRDARGSGGRGGTGDNSHQKGPMTLDQLGGLISGSIPDSR